MFHNHIAQRNIVVLYILIFKFLERSLEDKSVWTEFPALSLHFVKQEVILSMVSILNKITPKALSYIL